METFFVGSAEGPVEKWASNAKKGVTVTTFGSQCYDLFVDIKDNLYCSLWLEHRVVKKTLDVDGNTPTVVAGTGIAGSTSDMLNRSQGIFVDINLDLYVADCGNDRVQLFSDGESNGVTVAGQGKTLNIPLRCPTSVVLDETKNLFIVDRFNYRIIRFSSHGFDCVVGCSGASGRASHQLQSPTSAAFDNLGNIFVLDQFNYRIQKFLRVMNTFGE